MIEELKNFIGKIEDFDRLTPSEQTDFFGFFLEYECKQSYFKPSQIGSLFKELRILPLSNIPRYLNESSNKNKNKSKKRKVKFIKTKEGLHLISSFANELKLKITEEETPFISFSIDENSLEWKPKDIPYLNSNTQKNANFFTKLYFLLYHLENSLRKFLKMRLIAILGNDWENKLIQKVDLKKACVIRSETDLSEMLQERGNNILYYCMWDDYGKVIKQYPNILAITKESDEILAHLNSLSKIRNAIAHNVSTIPKEYQDELTLFLKKYIRILNKQNS